MLDQRPLRSLVRHGQPRSFEVAHQAQQSPCRNPSPPQAIALPWPAAACATTAGRLTWNPDGPEPLLLKPTPGLKSSDDRKVWVHPVLAGHQAHRHAGRKGLLDEAHLLGGTP